MKIYLIVGLICITAIVITSMGMGYDTGVATGGVAAVVALLTWQGKKALDKKGGDVEAVEAALKKAGYTDRFIATTIKRVKGGK